VCVRERLIHQDDGARAFASVVTRVEDTEREREKERERERERERSERKHAHVSERERAGAA